MCPGMFRLVDIYANPTVRTMCEALVAPTRGRDDAVADGVERARRRKKAQATVRMEVAGDV